MTDVYIYEADIWCEDCAEKIKERLDAAGRRPTTDDYDSGDYPKGPTENGGGEADTPQHCAAGAECVNADEGAGMFLENPLTSEGYDYVAESILRHAAAVVMRQPPKSRGVVLRLWFDFYGDEIDWSDIIRSCL